MASITSFYCAVLSPISGREGMAHPIHSCPAAPAAPTASEGAGGRLLAEIASRTEPRAEVRGNNDTMVPADATCGYDGLKVFSVTMAARRARLGEEITAWLHDHPEC